MTKSSNNSFTYEGKININTAGLPVLASMLPSENADLALAFFEWRQEAAADKDAADLSDPAWYRNIPGYSAMNLDTNLITTASDTFRIISAAKVNDFALATTAVVQRLQDKKTGKWTCKILSYQTE